MTDREKSQIEWEAVSDIAMQMGGTQAQAAAILNQLQEFDEAVLELMLAVDRSAPSKSVEKEWFSEVQEWIGLVLRGGLGFCENFRKEHMPDEGSDGK